MWYIYIRRLLKPYPFNNFIFYNILMQHIFFSKCVCTNVYLFKFIVVTEEIESCSTLSWQSLRLKLSRRILKEQGKFMNYLRMLFSTKKLIFRSRGSHELKRDLSLNNIANSFFEASVISNTFLFYS